MTGRKFLFSATLAAVGILVWKATAKISGEVEAWDSIFYFLPGLPLMFASAALAGYVEPKHPWIWGILVVVPQPVIMFSQTPSGPLEAVGVVIFGILAAAAAGFASLGKTIKTSRNKQEP